MEVSENGGPYYTTLNSRILINKDPKIRYSLLSESPTLHEEPLHFPPVLEPKKILFRLRFALGSWSNHGPSTYTRPTQTPPKKHNPLNSLKPSHVSKRALPMNWDEGPVLLLLLPGEGDADDALLLVLFVLLPTKCSSKPRPITANGLT